MRLSDYTDYSLRVLMCCAASDGSLLTVASVAETLQVSRNHLMKVVNDLANLGLLATTRGRGGGFRLSKAPADIGIGDVVRACETDFRLVECFDAENDTCTLTSGCILKGVMHRALAAYLSELDAVTLADLTQRPRRVAKVPAVVAIAPPRRRRGGG